MCVAITKINTISVQVMLYRITLTMCLFFISSLTLTNSQKITIHMFRVSESNKPGRKAKVLSCAL